MRTITQWWVLSIFALAEPLITTFFGCILLWCHAGAFVGAITERLLL